MNPGDQISAVGIASALPSLDADQVAWTQAASRKLEASGYQATVQTGDSLDENWFLGAQFAFTLCDNAPPRGAAAEDLMNTLDAHADVLSEIEKTIGLAAEFSDLGRLPSECATIELTKSNKAVCRLAIFAPVKAHRSAQQLTRFSPEYIVARLAVSEAEKVTSGDMIVLERGPWMIANNLPIRSRKTFGFCPETGRIAPIFTSANRSPFEQALDPLDMTKSTEPPEFQVPVSIHLDDIVMTTSETAAMLDKGAFDLGAIGEGMRASLSVGGRTLGRGEIVRLGDRFAVLLEDAPKAPHAGYDGAQNPIDDDIEDSQVPVSENE